MLQQHVDSGADITVATIEMIRRGSRPGDSASSKPIGTGACPGFRGKARAAKMFLTESGQSNASMGIYIFNTQLMIPILMADAEDPKSTSRFRHEIMLAPRHFQVSRLRLQLSGRKSQWRRCTGAMSELSTPTTKPTWISSRLASFQPVRQNLAAAHMESAISAGKICFRRPRAHGRGASIPLSAAARSFPAAA